MQSKPGKKKKERDVEKDPRPGDKIVALLTYVGVCDNDSGTTLHVTFNGNHVGPAQFSDFPWHYVPRTDGVESGELVVLEFDKQLQQAPPRLLWKVVRD